MAPERPSPSPPTGLAPNDHDVQRHCDGGHQHLFVANPPAHLQRQSVDGRRNQWHFGHQLAGARSRWRAGGSQRRPLGDVNATNNGAFAEICIANLYANQGTTNAYAADAYYYFAMFRGSPGIYVTEDMERSTNTGSAYVAGGADIPSLTSEALGQLQLAGPGRRAATCSGNSV
jgi:hypothetical protein